MNFNFLTAVALISFFTGCKEDTVGITALNQTQNGFDFPIGQKRITYNQFTMKGKKTNFVIPTISVFEIVKDTVVNGNSGKIITATYFRKEKDTSYSDKSSMLLLQEGNQTNMYDFKNGNSGSLFNLFKTGVYDTSAFSDKMTVIEFPLTVGKKWNIRDTAEPNGGLPLEKEFVRMDTLNFEGEKHQCAVFDLHSFVKVTTWVSKKGLLKAEIDYGMSEATDSNGVFIDSTSSNESFELLKINPTEPEIDSIKAKYSKLAKWD